MSNKYFIIDFDSTFVTLEALDTLADIALANNPQKEQILQQIKGITQLGMEGKMSFTQTLEKRLALFITDKSHIEKLVKILKKNITPSISRNKAFFKKNGKNVYIISGGFTEYIAPIVTAFGIPEKNILANSFLFDKKGTVLGFDPKNPLSQKQGKVKAVKSLRLQGEMYVIGDGYTDYEIKKHGASDYFYCFTENVRRDSVANLADREIASFDEVLFTVHAQRAQSYPKSKMKVLLLENIHETAVKALKKEGYSVKTFAKALSEKELTTELQDVSILGIRSKTDVTANVLLHAPKLIAIGAFCIGTNQIDLEAAARKGVVVFNAPYSNTRSVVELVVGEMILLMRGIIEKNNKLHKGVWDKSATGSHEIRGKTLGIVGYGNIGSQLSVVAENLGMKVIFYDLQTKLALGNAVQVKTLTELLSKSDIVTIHVDGRKSNKNVIGQKEFAKMRDGVIFLNLARGSIVDISALKSALKTGKVGGAAIDVFPHEPAGKEEEFISELRGVQNVLLTPHVGGSTEEAQYNIGEFVSEKLMSYINTGNSMFGVNFPEISLPTFRHAHRLLHIHENTPGVLAEINNIFAKYKINIVGQYLKTNEHIGYVVTDVNKQYKENVIEELKTVKGTIRLRVLY
ncbi:MAG TPA: phosphoglycerate dehydrogenase [Candidatus Levybacteria bacterium]|nr:phosphoglycerate dehydrogenase [Candidatus Levybacteria bacterium]